MIREIDNQDRTQVLLIQNPNCLCCSKFLRYYRDISSCKHDLRYPDLQSFSETSAGVVESEIFSLEFFPVE